MIKNLCCKRVLQLLFIGAVILCLNRVYGEEERPSRPLYGGNYFSPLLRTEWIVLKEGVFTYNLEAKGIIINSEKVFLGDKLLLTPYKYSIDKTNLTITLTEYAVDLIGDENILRIEYAVIPEKLLRQFSLFKSIDYSDTLSVQTVRARGVSFAFPDTDLTITGSKTFSISIGSDEDFSVNQSLFLRIDGELRPNLHIQAQISDSQSPLTPEGDTRELSSLDQLFIRLYGSIPREEKTFTGRYYNDYEIAFGDLELSFRETQFMNHWTHFEGVKAEWYGRNSFQAALALSKGKQTFTEFRGVDGKQGPYYLTISGVGGYVLVVPGSEEVYLDGVRLERGTGYRINFSEGSITFTSRHFIDRNSQIYVRFQYSDEEYRQYKYMSGNRIAVTDRLTAGFYMIVENDDKDNPLKGDLTEEEKNILKLAGDKEVWMDGAVKVGEGEGDYIKITDDEDYYYEYAGAGKGDYIIFFTNVGFGAGSYEEFYPGRFRYVGEGKGNFIPQRKLPSPESKANFDFLVQWKNDFWQIDGEGLVSHYDRNTFSSLDKEDNDGYATHWQLRLNPDFDRIETNFRLYHRYLSRYLKTFVDISDPEMDYMLMSDTQIDSVSVSELGTELSLGKDGGWNTTTKYFRKTGGNDKDGRGSFISDNLLVSLYMFISDNLPIVNYRYQYNELNMESSLESLDDRLTTKSTKATENFVRTEHCSVPTHATESDNREKEVNETQNSHFLKIEQTISFLKLAGDYQLRDYQTVVRTDSEEERDGLRYQFKRVSLGSHRTQQIAGNLFVSLDSNDDYQSGWERERESLTIGGECLIAFSDHNLKTAYSHRKVNRFGESETESFYDMADINIFSSLLNRGISVTSNYALVNKEFHPSIKELIYVGKNLGIYDSTGVFSEDGEYDYVFIPAGNPEMSIEINADINLTLSPRQFIDTSDDTDHPSFSRLIKDWLSRIQTEHYYMLAENSRSNEKWDVYLLKPSALMHEQNTIYGRLMERHTLWLDILPRRVLGRVMYQNNETLDKRYQERKITSDTQVNDYMVRINRLLGSDFELNYEKRKKRGSEHIFETDTDSYSLDIRNRISNNLNLATLLRYSRQEGIEQSREDRLKMDSFSIAETVNYHFQSKYRFFGRVEYRYNRLIGSGSLSHLPERREGNVFRWNARLNYTMNKYTTASVTYTGNKYPYQDTVHTINIELRAEF